MCDEPGPQRHEGGSRATRASPGRRTIAGSRPRRRAPASRQPRHQVILEHGRRRGRLRPVATDPPAPRGGHHLHRQDHEEDRRDQHRGDGARPERVLVHAEPLVADVAVDHGVEVRHGRDDLAGAAEPRLRAADDIELGDERVEVQQRLGRPAREVRDQRVVALRRLVEQERWPSSTTRTRTGTWPRP